VTTLSDFVISILTGVISAPLSVVALGYFGKNTIQFGSRINANKNCIFINVLNNNLFLKAYGLRVKATGELWGETIRFEEIKIEKDFFAYLTPHAKTGKIWKINIPHTLEYIQHKYKSISIHVESVSAVFGIHSYETKTYHFDSDPI